jgi:hypothetical protein
MAGLTYKSKYHLQGVNMSYVYGDQLKGKKSMWCVCGLIRQERGCENFTRNVVCETADKAIELVRQSLTPCDVRIDSVNHKGLAHIIYSPTQ